MASSPGTGASGTITADKPALQEFFKYYSQSQVISGITTATIYPLASDTVYRNADQMETGIQKGASRGGWRAPKRGPPQRAEGWDA